MSTTLTLDLAPPERTISPRGSFVLVRQRRDGTISIVAPRPPSALVLIGKRFNAAARAMGLSLFPALAKFAADMDRTMAQINAVLKASAPQPDPARLAGLEGRYYVRAAMDPAYATPWALSGLVRDLLDGTEGITGGRLPSAERRVLAVAAMRGWETRGQSVYRFVGDRLVADPPLIAHRLWGSTAVEVCCG